MQALSMIVSFIAMLWIVSSYFVKAKSGFLLFQSLGIIFLMISYFCNGAFFAMVGHGIGLARVLIYYAFEKQNKKTPLFFPIFISILSVLAYIVMQGMILQTVVWYDVIYLIALVGYTFVFTIRNLEIMLYTVTIPTALSVLYNVVSGAAVFAVLSYTFELCANLAAIFKYHIWEQPKKRKAGQKKACK